MTQRQDTPVRRLVEDLMSEEGGDTIRLLMERMLNRLLEAEQAEHLQALPYERTDARQGLRNGYRTRQMVTCLGQITLRVPRTRDGEFSSNMFRRFQRSERALQLGLVEMYVHGVSTRKVTEVADHLRWVYEARDEKDARARLASVVEQMSGRWPEVAEKLELEGEQSLAVYDLPRSHHRRMRTTNGLERFHEELRRRSRVVRIYPSRAALARLMGALIIEQDEKWLTDKRYLNMALLGELRREESGDGREVA